ncbi:MAG: hypothetical protein Q8M76_14455 [Spirochaetaceae bacterium]|nr:hypothetical protein [Spirochaetaceae bacterium]
MHVDVFTLCDFAQESDGKLTVVGAFDTLFARQFPAVHPLMCLAVRLRFYIHEGGKHSINIKFLGPNGAEVIKHIDGEISVGDFSGSSRVVHSIFNFVNTSIEREGAIGITLSVDGKETLTSPLYVRKT